jgi:hypothetical protein
MLLEDLEGERCSQLHNRHIDIDGQAMDACEQCCYMWCSAATRPFSPPKYDIAARDEGMREKRGREDNLGGRCKKLLGRNAPSLSISTRPNTGLQPTLDCSHSPTLLELQSCPRSVLICQV